MVLNTRHLGVQVTGWAVDRVVRKGFFGEVHLKTLMMKRSEP